MANNVLRYLGLGLETIYGVAPAEADFHIDPASISLDSPSEPFITYEGGVGRMPSSVIPGVYFPSGGADFPANIAILAYLLYLALGDQTLTDNTTPVVDEPFSTGPTETSKTITLVNNSVIQGSVKVSDTGGLIAEDNGWGKMDEALASGVTGWINYKDGIMYLTGLTPSTSYTVDYSEGTYKHDIIPVTGNTAPSFTAFAGKDIFEHDFTGCVINSIDFSVNQELINITMDIVGKTEAKATILSLADLKQAFGCHGERPTAFHEMSLLIGDYAGALSDISAKVRSFSMSIANNASTEENIGLGDRFPYNGTFDMLDITGSMTLQFEDTSYKEDFWGAAGGPLSDPQLKAMRLNIAPSPSGWGFADIFLDRVLLQSVNIQPSGRARLYQEISFKALYDCTNNTIIRCEVTNLNRFNNPA